MNRVTFNGSPSVAELDRRLEQQGRELAASASPLLRPTFMSARELMIAHPHLRPPVLHGLLREGESMNVIAPPKRGKSWLIGDLALCIAAGTPWLDTFRVERGDVLVLDNELHKETISNRLPRLAEARGLRPEQWVDHVYVESLRGRIADIYQLASYFAGIERGRFKVVIVDAWYRVQPREMSENSNGEVANLYNAIDKYAADICAAFALIHHSSKGNQSEKSVTDVGSGGSAQSRAADVHMVLRDHEEDGAVVVDAAVRSFPPVQSVCLRWNFPLWTPAPELDPLDLRKAGSRKKQDSDEPVGEPWTLERFVATFIMAQPVDKKLIRAEAVGTGLSGRQADDFLVRAESEGLAHRWRGKGNQVRLASVSEPEIDSETHTRAPPTPPSSACARTGAAVRACAHDESERLPI